MLKIRQCKYMPEKSNEILIPEKKTINNSSYICHNKEYSEKEIFFDPSKHSPPNEFLIKLQKRMKKL